ncbi:BrnT family toxin [bacterium]|nr:BrnT family toxin [bacterium]
MGSQEGDGKSPQARRLVRGGRVGIRRRARRLLPRHAARRPLLLIGYSRRERLLYVVHAEVQLDVIRIISARKATRHEQTRYESD